MTMKGGGSTWYPPPFGGITVRKIAQKELTGYSIGRVLEQQSHNSHARFTSMYIGCLKLDEATAHNYICCEYLQNYTCDNPS